MTICAMVPVRSIYFKQIVCNRCDRSMGWKSRLSLAGGSVIPADRKRGLGRCDGIPDPSSTHGRLTRYWVKYPHPATWRLDCTRRAWAGIGEKHKEREEFRAYFCMMACLSMSAAECGFTPL